MSFLLVGSRAMGRRANSRLLGLDRKSTRLNSSHANISYAVFCLKKEVENVISGITIRMNITKSPTLKSLKLLKPNIQTANNSQSTFTLQLAALQNIAYSINTIS